MTVAAVILAASPGAALADADGTPAVRRLVDAAWAGGATPVVVCAADPDGAVATTLATAEATLVDDVASAPGTAAQAAAGVAAATGLVAGTEAVLLWPADHAWVDAETVTTLLAAHGEDRRSVIRPAYRGAPGLPVLVPVAHLPAERGVGTDLGLGGLLDGLEAAGIAVRILDTGDPGVTHDLSVRRADLPPYDGPPEPAATPEWGSAVADQPDDAPLRPRVR